MVVTRVFSALSLLLLLSACSNQPQAGQFEKSVTAECAANEIPQSFMVVWKDGRITQEKSNSEDEFISEFMAKHAEKIVFAEPEYLIRLNDDLAIKQNFDQSTLPPVNWGASDLGAQNVWNQNIKGQGIVVAVIDSGTDISHPQLAGRIFVNSAEANGIAGKDDDGNGYVDDVNGWNFAEKKPLNNDDSRSGHGTHVAGTVAAEHSKGEILGIAPEAKILPLDFMWRPTGYPDVVGSTSAAIEALNYAAKMGARVVNASWGGGCSKSLQSAFTKHQGHNMIFVVAAGNSGNDISYYPEYPAAWQQANQITVGASRHDGYRADFSNYGALVDVVAPGAYIDSTVPFRVNPSGYGLLSGTSMAAPHVSGMIAAIWSAYPNASPGQIKAAVLSTVQVGPFDVATRGKVRMDLSLNYLRDSN